MGDLSDVFDAELIKILEEQENKRSLCKGNYKCGSRDSEN
jgi:hypothetical protein